MNGASGKGFKKKEEEGNPGIRRTLFPQTAPPSGIFGRADAHFAASSSFPQIPEEVEYLENIAAPVKTGLMVSTEVEPTLQTPKAEDSSQALGPVDTVRFVCL